MTQNCSKTNQFLRPGRSYNNHYSRGGGPNNDSLGPGSRRARPLPPIQTRAQRELPAQKCRKWDKVIHVQRHVVSDNSVLVSHVLHKAIVHVLLEQTNVCTLARSQTVQQLQSMKIALMGTEMENKDLPFAGRLKYFQTNWQCITQDPWVLKAVASLRIDFLLRPWQTNKPHKQT